MHIVEPTHFKQLPTKPRRSRSVLVIAALVPALLLLGFTMPANKTIAVQATPEVLQGLASENVMIAWPQYGQAALAADTYGLLDRHGSQTPLPTASVAKVMTALAVLKQRPLNVGQSGPMIMITSEDVKVYQDYASADGSVVPVFEGEQISEYQALQALLLPSSNNMAVTLTRWAFGSTTAYLEYANKLSKTMGMKQSHFADASGFSPDTKSTAEDLVLMGQAAMQNPVLAEIVNQKAATITYVGEVHNVNWLLGSNGVNGIKTGNTNEAGGCYLFSAKQIVPGGKTVTLVGAVMGAPNLRTAMSDSVGIINTSIKGFEPVSIIKKSQRIGTYSIAERKSNSIASNPITLLRWRGWPVGTKVAQDSLQLPATKGSTTGYIEITNGPQRIKTPTALENELQAPKKHWLNL